MDGQPLYQTVTDTTGGDAPRTVSWGYNPRGQQSTQTDPADKTTTVEYDEFGRIKRETDPDGGITESQYAAKGQLIRTVVKNFTGDPNNPSAPADLEVTRRSYDPAGRLATVVDAQGWETLYTYTDNDLMAKTTRRDPNTAATFVPEETFYDAAGNVTSRKTNGGRTTTTYVVDAASRTTGSVLDPNGVNRITTNTLSADDFVTNTKVTNAGGTLLSSTDVLYDPLGRPVAETVHNGALAPAGRWKFDETSGTTAADATGNSPATLTNASWSTERGGSISFAGSTGQGACTGGPVVDNSRSFTVSAWVKMSSLPTGNKYAVGQEGPRRSGFMLGYDGVATRWRIMLATSTSDAASAAKTSNAVPVANVWTHLTGIYESDQGRLRLFVNGVLDSEGTHTTKWEPAIGPLCVGRIKWAGTPGHYWPGLVDDVQVYQKALSASEVASVYNGTAPTANTHVVRNSWNLDQSGLATSMRDPNGKTTDYSLDEAGRVAVVTSPAVQTEIGGGTPVSTRPTTYIGYDTFGAVTETKDANGNVSVAAYDAAGRLASTTLPNYTPPGSSTPITAVTTRAYDDVGQMISTTDPLNKTTTFVYDQLGRVAKVTAPDGGETKYTYTNLGEQTSVTDPTAARSEATYDYLGRLTHSIQIVRQTASNHQTLYSYGPGGWLSSTQSPTGVTQSVIYNEVGEPTQRTDGAGKITRFTYDDLGQTRRTTLPDNSYTEPTYDMAGQVTYTRTYDPAGTQLTVRSTEYDRAGTPGRDDGCPRDQVDVRLRRDRSPHRAERAPRRGLDRHDVRLRPGRQPDPVHRRPRQRVRHDLQPVGPAGVADRAGRPTCTRRWPTAPSRRPTTPPAGRRRDGARRGERHQHLRRRRAA